MKFYAFGLTNRSYGCGPWRPLAELISVDLPDFGTGIREIGLTIYCNGRSQAPARDAGPGETMPGMSSRGSADFPPLDAHPKTRFQRKKAALHIDFPSTRFTPDAAFNFDYKTMERADLAQAMTDIRAALDWGLNRAVKRADDFDTTAFLRWLDGWRGCEVGLHLPLFDIWSAADAELRREREAADPWTLLSVDWDRMHPQARVLLDRPDDWSETDEFSPHGSDVGADIFADWSSYAQLTPEKAAMRMGWNPAAPEMKEVMEWDWFGLHLALAFGHIKRNGTCPPVLAARTCEVIDQLRDAKDPILPAHRAKWQGRVDRYRSILAQFLPPCH
jgi:hypothetical protein